ncbi:MAG: hypothetical protein OXC28_06675 [Defluviicoccus sp.]|nr:hypothetical protein [Defluviicoccus sp.]
MEAQLAARNAALGEIAATLPDLHASAGKIDTATEWANNIKAGTERLLEINSKLIEGLEGGRGDLDKTIAEIRIQKDSLGEQLTSFDKGVQELRDLWKVVDQRTRALETAEKELAGHYKNWTVGGTDFRRDINALSERLGKGDEIVSQIGRAQDAWTDKASKVLEADAEAHRLASGQVSSDVDKLREAGQDFMEELRKYRAATDKDIRKKQNWIRRWAVPALFLLVMPSLGALGQSELGFFEAHDDTGGSKQFVWDNHGDRVRECMLASKRTRSVIKCTFNVRYP